MELYSTSINPFYILYKYKVKAMNIE